LRLDAKPPNIIIKKKDRGGINIEMVKGRLNEETVRGIVMEYLSNADIFIREDVNEEQIIDALIGNRVYIPSLVVVNKIDAGNPEKMENVVYVSAKTGKGIEELKKKIVEKLGLIRIYLKPEGKKVEEEPMVLRKGAKIRDVCLKLHRELLENFRYAVIYGPSADFPGQRVGLNHELKDGDIVTIVAR
jgi:ribosome-interacting GTPase 1